MAKSLRSKWRRKCRAIKRIRYGEKELERLKKTLGIDESAKNPDISMSDVQDLVTVTDAKAIKESQASDVTMEVDGKKRTFNLKSMRDQYGTPPIWMHQRKIKKNKKKKEKNKKKRKQ